MEYFLPIDIQYIIWKICYNNVINDIRSIKFKKCLVFLKNNKNVLIDTKNVVRFEIK